MSRSRVVSVGAERLVREPRGRGIVFAAVALAFILAALAVVLALVAAALSSPPAVAPAAGSPVARAPAGPRRPARDDARAREADSPPAPLPAAPAVALEGRLVVAGTGLSGEAGVSVAIRAAGEPRGACSIRAATGDDGSFLFDLAREGEYEIVLDRGPYRDRREIVSVSGEKTSVEIAVEAGATLEGRVVTRHPDGAPIGVGGARVVLVDAGAAVRREALSAEGDGAFSLRGLPEGPLSEFASVRVAKPGYFGVVPRRRAGLDSALSPSADGPLVVEVVPAASVSGRLVPSSPGGEISPGEIALFPGMELGTVIDAFDRDTASRFGRATLAGLVAAAGLDGRFRLKAVPPHVGLTLEARDGTRALATAALRPLLPGEALDLGDVALAPCAAASGVVLDDAGEAAAGALVRADCASVAVGAAADADGRFRLEGLEPGPVRFSARAASGGAPATPVDALLLPGERATDVVLRLAPCASIEGVVATAEGEPVAGAEVAAYDATPRGGAPRRAVTDAFGRFSIGGLRRDAPFDVEVRASGFVCRPARGIVPGGSPLALAVRRPASVSGEVAGPESLGSVFLTVKPLDAGARGVSLALSRPGPFRADGLEPGDYLVVARVDGVERGRAGPVSLPDGAAESGIVLEIGPPERAAFGSVSSYPEGVAVAGARLELFARRDGAPLARFGARSGASGRFRIALPPDAAPVGLVARAAPFGAASVALEPGAAGPIDVRLGPGGRLSLVLVSASDSAPLAVRATVVAARADVPVALPIPLDGTTAGRFEADLEPGVYDVAVRADGHAAAVIEGVVIAAGGVDARRVALQPAPSGEGRCRAE